MLAELGFIFSEAEGSNESSAYGWSPFIAFAIVLAIMAFMPRIIRKIRRERQALAQQEMKEIQNRPNIRSKADEILVELAEMSREINAQVDTKIRVLNKLIRDADKIVRRYEELAGTEIKRPDNLSKPVPEEGTLRSSAALAQDKAEIILEPEESASDGHGTLKERAERNIQQQISSGMPETSETGVWQRSVGSKIKELHDKGYEINDIARKTRMSVAEVTLMLEMFKKKD